MTAGTEAMGVSEPSPAPRRKRRWLRRILLGLALLVVLVLVAGRIALPYVLPGLIDGALEPYGLRLDYERLDLSLFGGEIEIWHARLLPREGGEAFAELEHVRADAEVRELFAGRLAVRIAQVSGLDLVLDRRPDGEFELLRRFGPGGPRDPSKRADREGPPDFTIPVAVTALRAQNVRVTLRDRTLDPPFTALLNANVRVSDLGTEGRNARLEVLLHAPGLLETLTVEGSLGTGPDWASTGIRVRAVGLRPGRVAPYLEPLGIRAVAEVLDLEFGADVLARVEEGRLGATVSLANLAVRADGREAAAVDRLWLVAPSVGGGHLKVGRLEVEGVRGRVEMLPAGGVRAGGIDVVKRRGKGPRPPRPSAERPAPAAGPATRIEVGDVVVRDVRAVFVDRTLSPPPEYAVQVTGVTARGFDTADPSSPMTFSVAIAVPALVKRIRIDGEAAILAEEKTARLEFLAEGIDTREAMDYVAVTGLGPEFEDGRLTFSLTARSTHGSNRASSARLDLTDLLFTSAGTELLSIGAIRVEDLSIDPRTGDVIVAEVGVGPIRAFARRSPDGGLHLPGLCVPAARPSPAPQPPARVPVEEEPPPPPPGARLPTVRVRDLAVNGIDVFLRDEARAKPLELTLAKSEVRVGGFVLEPGEEDPPATFAALLHAPGIAEDVRIEGTFRMPAPEVRADLAVNMTGITAAAVQPILDEMGAAARLADATLGFRFRGTARPAGDGVEAVLSVADLEFRDAEAGRLAGLGRLDVSRLALGKDGLDVGEVAVSGPYLRLRRDAGGGIEVLGFRLPPPAPPPPPDSGGVSGPAAEPLAVRVAKVSLTDAGLDLREERAGGPVDLSLVAGAELADLRFGRRTAARFAAEVRETLRGLSLRTAGSADIGPEMARAAAEVALAGLSREALRQFLPAGIESTTGDGRLTFRVEASRDPCPEGGERLGVAVADLVLREGGTGPVLFSTDAIGATVSRFDLPGRRVAVDELRLSGVVAEIGKSAADLRVPGFRIVPAAAPAAASAPDRAGNGGLPPSRAPLPLVTIERVEVHVKRLGWRDEGFARPLEFTDLRLRNEGTIAALGEDANSQPHARLMLEGAVAPLVSKVDLALHLAPFADQPEADAVLALEGIRGATLAEFLPGLARKVDAAVLTDGRLHLGAHARLSFRRSGPLDFDLSRGVGMEVFLREFELSNAGRPLLGVAEVAAVVQRFDPGTGDLHIKSLEVATPHGDVSREPEGLRVAGILLRRTPEETAAAPAASAGPAAGAAPAGPEVRVDSLFVTDLDMTFADRTGEPHAFLPLRDLTLEVRGFTTRAFSAPVPVAFRAAVASDKVQLPLDPPRTVDAFGDLSVSGRLQFFPGLRGRVTGGLSSLELVNFRGVAKQSAVDLGGGILDAGVDLRFLEDDTLDFSSRFVFTDLDMSEPPDGPIARFLRLPTPLNAVIFILRDESGAIAIPLNFTAGSSGVGTGQIAEIAISTLGRLIARAVAASPLRVAGTLTGGIGAVGGAVGGIFGLGGGEKEPPPERPPVAVGFSAGDVTFASAEAARLRELLEELDDDDELVVSLRVELGTADLERLRVLANPSPEDARDLVEALRRRKFDLLRQRAEAAAEARAALTSGLRLRADAAAVELRGIERDLSRTEEALDEMLDLLRPGADRVGERRTRLAAVALMDLRQQEVVRFLLGQEIEEIASRIRLKRPRFQDPTTPAGRVLLSLRREVRK